jgi:NTP pyrophosphatase (non-canonical NTP hydrolase)
MDQIDKVLALVRAELERAESKHAPMHSPHEGYSVLLEEVEELREHVRANTGRSLEAAEEAIQVAAMGARYVLNLCGAALPQA